jgi:hypothetical protein
MTRIATKILGANMRKALLTAACTFATILPAALAAQERAIDGTLGAVAGAVVAGPVGLVAGAVVGVTAGPSISSSWGLHHYHHYHRAHYETHAQH